MIYEIFFWSVYFLSGILGQIYSELHNLFYQNISPQIFLPLQDFAAIIIQNHILITLSILCGILIGFTLGLIGGGGSILAVPLLVYLIGLNPHVAIGTSALVVAINAIINFLDHRKKGHVLLKTSLLFAIPGVMGTLIGSQMGLLTPPNTLLIFFALFMISIAIKILLEKKSPCNSDEGCDKNSKAKKNSGYNGNGSNIKPVIMGSVVGLGAGYFGIGGGFLIVPSLMHLGVNIVNSIGTSLLPVSLFGMTTAVRYSLDSQIDFWIASLLIIGGIGGGKVGTIISSRSPKTMLTKIFAILLIIVGIYITIKTVLG